MVVCFDTTKECKCYREFVENPTDRKARRAFQKIYNTISDDAIKLHSRLVSSPNAKHFNMLYTGDNSIQKTQGTQGNNPLVLKVRVNHKGYRKFFHYICNVVSGSFLLTKDWTGQFENVTHLWVIDINKHDYNSVS